VTDLPTAALSAGAQVLQAQGWLREGSGVLEAQRAAEVAIRAALPLLYPAVEDPELSEVERRAMRADFHGGTCKTPLVACSYCIAKLGEVRQVLKAAGPVIEQEARAAERREAEEAAARFRAIVEPVAAGEGSA
jgi:hypothetical protein